MNWIMLALLSAFLYGVYNFFMKLAANKIDASYNLILFSVVGVVVGLLWALWSYFSGAKFALTSDGITYTILAGLFAGIGTIAFFLMFVEGAKLSVGLPLAVGGTILVGTVLGIVVLQEPLTLIEIAGILTTLVGIALLSQGG